MLIFRQPFNFLLTRECLRVKALFFLPGLFPLSLHNPSPNLLFGQSFIDGKPPNGGTMPQTANCLVS